MVGLGLVCIDDDVLTHSESVYDLQGLSSFDRFIHGNLVALCASVFSSIFLVQSKETNQASPIQRTMFLNLISLSLFTVLSLLS